MTDGLYIYTKGTKKWTGPLTLDEIKETPYTGKELVVEQIMGATLPLCSLEHLTTKR